MLTVPLAPITRAAFAPFGQLLDTPGDRPRVDQVAALRNARAGAQPNMAVTRALPAALPFRVRALERHEFSSQAFLPLDVARYLVLVAPDKDDAPDLTGLRAFAVPGTVGINYLAGTWHHGLTSLDSPGIFALFDWEDGTAGDVDIRPVESPVLVVAAQALSMGQ